MTMSSTIARYLRGVPIFPTPFCANEGSTEWKVCTMVGQPKVDFSASCNKSRVAVIAHGHTGHPFSSILTVLRNRKRSSHITKFW
jgi:hypothetical protein